MAFMTKFISSEFFRETTIDGFSNISRTKSVRACTFWFAVTCLASLVAVYQITDEVTAKFVDASKLIFRPAWPGEAFYPQIKFCYEHWSQWVMINNETRTIDPMVLNVLCNIQMRNKVLMDACAMLNITDVHAHIHTYSDSFLNLGKLYERFFDRNFEDDSNDTTHQPGKLYFDELKGQMCIVLEPIAGKWVTNPKMGQTLVMHVPFVYTNTLRKPIREIIENDHVLKKPGMVYLDDKPVFPLWHMSNAVQTVTLMSTTVVYLKNIRPSYKCQRDGQITEYKNTVSSSYLVEDCEDICQDNTHGVLLVTQETFNHMQGCSRRENRSMPNYQKFDYTSPASDYNINANRGDCLKWIFDVLTMGTTLNNYGWQHTKLRIIFPELEEWLVIEHAEDTSWLDVIANIGGTLGLWTGASILSLVHLVYYLIELTCRKKPNTTAKFVIRNV